MPATESTWRDTAKMHRIFAISGVILTIATVWMFYKDHVRPWKDIQPTAVNVDLKMNSWRQEQFETTEAVLTHQRLSRAVTAAAARPLDAALLAEFKKAVEEDAQSRRDSVPLAGIESRASRLNEQSQVAREKRTEADAALAAAEKQPADAALLDTSARADAAALTAEQRAAATRGDLVAELQAIIKSAKDREDKALGLRKFKSANIDASKAKLDIAIRDNLGAEEIARRQKVIDDLVKGAGGYNELDFQYQTLSAHRKKLDKLLKGMTAEVDDAQKAYADSIDALQRLEKQYKQQEETYFTLSSQYPFFFGKKILTLPILDAFNSPRKIENLWAEGLMQDYNFSKVRRFDRCTTCHVSMQKTLPGMSTTPSYIEEETLEMVLIPPPKDAPPQPKKDLAGNPLPLTLADWIGVRLADKGLLNPDDVTVSLVLPKTPGARAQMVTGDDGATKHTGEEIRQTVATLTSPPGGTRNQYQTLAGLQVGDVIVGVDGSLLFGGNRGPKRVEAMFMTLAQEGKPIRLTVRRGLPNPYIAHPRLDLFISDNSPHPMQKFACTICHDGQGSATEFKWASHTPNNLLQADRWNREQGWFDNHHWIYPMFPQRFAESACLKCHHQVVELEPSDKYTAGPAPKVVRGYHLIRKYGCYGCHEVNGFDGPVRRIGPDLRLEPNYFAAAQSLYPFVPARVQLFAGEKEKLDAELAPFNEQLKTLANERAPLDLQKAELGKSDAPDKDEQVKKIDEALAANTEKEKEIAKQTEPLRQKLTPIDGHLNKLDELIQLAETVTAHPERDDARRRLMQLIDEDSRPGDQSTAVGADQSTTFGPSIHKHASLLKDVEAPGQLRKAGPSLRYIGAKLDRAFLYDWLKDPKHFRPSTRMPQFFGLWKHLEEHGEMADQKAPKLEPIEIRGMIEYLTAFSQNGLPGVPGSSGEKLAAGFQPLPKPAGIDAWTDDEKLARGKEQFQVRGCLACHTHKDFPDVSKYRPAEEIVQGPDLSAVGDKFGKERNPAGPDWLYSWIKEPTRYHARTVMPNLFLDPVRLPGADPMDPADDKWSDPADDIATYLLADSTSDWKPVPAAASAGKPLDAAGQEALKDLLIQYLYEAFYKDAADQYYVLGIPPELEGELKGAEKDLIVPHGGELTEVQRLRYIGRKSISKYGCFGCHDIPGFEDAKPIGTGLADWGRKDPAKLAFEHITHYVEGHGHGPNPDDAGPGEPHSEFIEHAEVGEAETVRQESQNYYLGALQSGNRIGFIYQKLKEPRSYDFEKTQNKRYNERLRMPQFPFTLEEREAVISFVLGLVADPPTPKYVFSPNPRTAALVGGKKVLEKYNCGGCHILQAEKWDVTYAPGDFGPQNPVTIYPFLRPYASSKELEAEATPDYRNQLHSHLTGLPALNKNDALPIVTDIEGLQLQAEEPYSQSELRLSLDLMKPALIDGNLYITGQGAVSPTTGQIDARYPTWGGVLTKYLLPHVTQIEKRSNANAPGSEAFGWLPPPLVGEGNKVQSDWLHDFLLEPYPIRPATFLRMPRFNMSSDEATALVDYFAAVDNADYPYQLNPERLESELVAKAKAYANTLQRDGVASDGASWKDQPAEALVQKRFNDALNIVVSGDYCVKCHKVADFSPTGNIRAQAPNLADVYRRLKPLYVRDWLANPKMILPYTPMPVNIAYDPAAPYLGSKVKQDLYHGTSIEQVEGVVDLLMNYDQFSRQSKKIAELVKPATLPVEPAAGTATGSQ